MTERRTHIAVDLLVLLIVNVLALGLFTDFWGPWTTLVAFVMGALIIIAALDLTNYLDPPKVLP